MSRLQRQRRANPEFRGKASLRRSGWPLLWARLLSIIIAAVGFVAPWRQTHGGKVHDRCRVRAGRGLRSVVSINPGGGAAVRSSSAFNWKFRGRQPVLFAMGDAAWWTLVWRRCIPESDAFARQSCASGLRLFCACFSRRDSCAGNRGGIGGLSQRMGCHVCSLYRHGAAHSEG